MNVALPGVGVRGVELFIHQPRERVDLPCIDGGCGAALGAGMIERRLGALPLRFEGGGAFPQDVIKFDDAVFNRTVKALEAIFGIAEFPLQIEQPAVRRLTLRGLPFHQRLQEIGNSVGGQDALFEVG
ncbi:hypothetical protein [Bradyrhizobium sp. USDA 377]